MKLDDWVRQARGLGASDLLLESGTPIVVRVRDELLTIGETVSEAQLTQCARQILGDAGWERFEQRGSADLSEAIADVRCRLNWYRTARGMALALRLLSASLHDLRSANLHPDLRRLVEPRTGLVVISGPTGCGKSTTLAALIEEVNAVRARNIITIESPIEYLFENRRSFIRQREVPTHSPSYEQAIVDALRENPDILVIGEMRSAEAMRLTLNAAETGHLVLATMHSATCAEALSRLCMSFAAEIQGSIRAQLADCLVGVVCQRLDYLAREHLRVPRCEVLMATSGAKGTIRSGQFSQLATVLQAGGEDGMWTFDRYERWIQQRGDWVVPSAGVSARPSAIQRAPASARATPPPASDAIEISIDEDLDLAEIARRFDGEQKK